LSGLLRIEFYMEMSPLQNDIEIFSEIVGNAGRERWLSVVLEVSGPNVDRQPCVVPRSSTVNAVDG
tara:strand:+ start:493 stop:690 length:198 start_codon:yes stop_codon:yes gene_type:complete